MTNPSDNVAIWNKNPTKQMARSCSRVSSPTYVPSWRKNSTSCLISGKLWCASQARLLQPVSIRITWARIYPTKKTNVTVPNQQKPSKNISQNKLVNRLWSSGVKLCSIAFKINKVLQQGIRKWAPMRLEAVQICTRQWTATFPSVKSISKRHGSKVESVIRIKILCQEEQGWA